MRQNEKLKARVEELEKACREAIKELQADIPSHPMRDKCFQAMSIARRLLSYALVPDEPDHGGQE